MGLHSSAYVSCDVCRRLGPSAESRLGVRKLAIARGAFT